MKPMRLESSFSGHFLVWMCILLRAVCFNVDAEVSSEETDHLVRAAFMSIAVDDDLAGISTSVRQLEADFDSEHQYNWVFFPSQSLSEHFRIESSNFTQAICLYEAVSLELWLSEVSFLPPTESWDQVEDVEPIASPSFHCPGLGFFALEHRMKDYDWFWRVYQGVSSTLRWY
jgi:hypothetical protein